MRGKKGYTVAEVVVATAIGSIILGVTWSMLSSSSRQGKKADTRLQGVHAGLIFAQRFEHDFRRLYLDDDHDIEFNPGGKPGIAFFIYDAGRSDLAGAERFLARVEYVFVPDRHAIYRKEASKKPRRLKGWYEALVFKRHGFHDYARPPSSPPAPGGLVTYLVTAAPRELFELPPDKRRAADRTTFWCSLPMRSANLSRRYPDWNPPPFRAPSENSP